MARLQALNERGMRRGAWARDTTQTGIVNFGTTSVIFNGTLTIPTDPGVGNLQADGSLSLTGLRLVKLGTPGRRQGGQRAVGGDPVAHLVGPLLQPHRDHGRRRPHAVRLCARA